MVGPVWISIVHNSNWMCEVSRYGSVLSRLWFDTKQDRILKLVSLLDLTRGKAFARRLEKVRHVFPSIETP